MGEHSSPEAIKKSVRTYMFVFGALLVGTILTVWAATLEFNKTHPKTGIAVALLIASVKSFLVAGYFMHLLSEKKAIYATLATTVFFFIGLMGLTLWSMNDFPYFTAVWK
jgi:cytochrome c oxidase subunit IV